MKAVLALLCIMVLCSSCWDTKEINQLAIVNISAADLDPKTKKVTAYYQVINPSSLSSKGNSSSNATVYTYSFTDDNWTKVRDHAKSSIPRILFSPHTQSYLITERYARHGFLDLVNYLEQTREHRTNVFTFITDSPAEDAMNSYTSLERLPGRFIRSMMAFQMRNIGAGVIPTHMKDIIEGISLTRPSLIPILHFNGSKPASNTSKYDQIDASKQSLRISDFAVVRQAKMIGKISSETANMIMILNNQASRLISKIDIHGASVDVEANQIKAKRKQIGTDTIRISLEANLKIINNQQSQDLTASNVNQIEMQFSSKFLEQANAVVRLTQTKGWDFLGLQDQGYFGSDWQEARVVISMQAKVSSIGKILNPYSFPGTEE